MSKVTLPSYEQVVDLLEKTLDLDLDFYTLGGRINENLRNRFKNERLAQGLPESVTLDEIEESARTGKRIKAPLVLTEKGNMVVAGQSVASAILHLMKGVPFQVKDVDVFYSVKTKDKYHPDNHTDIPQSDDSFVIRNPSINNFEGSRYSSVVPEDPISYVIKNSEEDGWYNYVEVNKTSASDVELSFSHEIIRGFDLNMVQAGLDLKSKHLVVTKEFLSYLENNQVEINRFGMPLRSVARLFSKLEKIGGYANKQRVMELLATSFAVSEATKNGLESELNAYGKGSVDIMREFISLKILNELKKHPELNENFRFDVVNIDSLYKNKSDAQRISASTGGLYQITWANPDLIRMDWVENMKLYPETIHPITRLTLESRMDSGKWKRSIIDQFRQELRKNSSVVLGKFGYMAQVAPKKNESNEVTGVRAREAAMSALLMKFGPDLIALQIEKKMINRLMRINENHDRAFSRIMLMVHDAESLAFAINEIEALEKEFGELIYGTFESLEKVYNTDLRRKTLLSGLDGGVKNVKKMFSQVRRGIKQMIRVEGKDLVEPFFEGKIATIDTAKGKVLIRELTSPLDLRIEGDQMHHCVGGYSYALKDKTSRFFSLTTLEKHEKKEGKHVFNRTTLQAISDIHDYNVLGNDVHHGNSRLSWRIAQNYAHSNQRNFYPELELAAHMIAFELTEKGSSQHVAHIKEFSDMQLISQNFGNKFNKHPIEDIVDDITNGYNSIAKELELIRIDYMRAKSAENNNNDERVNHDMEFGLF